MRILCRYCLPVIVWMVVIFCASTDTFSPQHTSSVIEPLLRFIMPDAPLTTMDSIHHVIRKCSHAVEYFILGFFLFRAFRRGLPGIPIWKLSALALLVTILYAASDEFHQSFTVARTASVADIGIDAIGGILAQVVIIAWY